MRRAIAACALIALSGCSVLNRPDPVPPARSDAGPFDGGPDGGADAGYDARPNYDGCTVRTTRELDCRDGMDDDCDSLVDCQDFECIGSPDCCGSGDLGDLFNEDWSTTTAWEGVPAASPPTVVGGSRVRFGGSGDPKAFIRDACSPLLLGATFTANFAFTGERCEAGTCDDYASIVLTYANDLVAPNQLQADIRVAITGDGRVQIGRGPDILVDRADVTFTATPTVTLDVTPGTNASGSPVLLARVLVGATEIASDLTVLRIGNPPDPIRGPLECMPEGLGLFFAVEGRGDLVQIDEVSGSALRCANPTQFTRPPVPAITPMALGLASSWTSGGIGAPTLASYVSGTPTFQLLVDGSNALRADETWQHVGLAIGGAESSNDMRVWIARDPNGGTPDGQPAIGDDPPQPMEGVTPGTSVREPSLYANLDTMSRLSEPMVGVYAAEHEFPDAERDVFGIQPFNLFSSRMTGITPVGPAYIAPVERSTATETDCISMRDPLILPRSSTATSDGYWLFYTCIRVDTADPRRLRHRFPIIQARRLSGALMPEGDPVTVVTEGISPFASRGVFGAEGVVRFDAAAPVPNATYRLWFIGTDARGATSVLMAQTEGPANLEQLRPFVGFPANPVLTSSSPLFGPCTGTACLIEGLSATIKGGRGDEIWMLVSRSINSTSGVTYELVPLVQFWPDL